MRQFQHCRSELTHVNSTHPPPSLNTTSVFSWLSMRLAPRSHSPAGWDSWLYIYAIASRSHILANSSSCLDEPPTRRVGAANTARLQSRQHGAAPDSYNSRPLVKIPKSLPFCTGGLVLTRLDPPHTTVRRHTRLSQRYTSAYTLYMKVYATVDVGHLG